MATAESVEAEIYSEHYFIVAQAMDCPGAIHVIRGGNDWHPGKTQMLTLCVIQLLDGTIATGESLFDSPSDFDPELGRKIARECAVAKLVA